MSLSKWCQVCACAALAALLVVMIGTPVGAQEQQGQQGQQGMQQQGQPGQQGQEGAQQRGQQQQGQQGPTSLAVQGSNELIGMTVKNDQGEELGSVEDLVLTPDRNQVSYLVLSRGGLLGMGEKLFAVPFSAVQIQKGADHVTLSISKEQLEQAPGFNEDNWPDMGNPRWRSEVGQFYSSQTRQGQQRSGQRGMEQRGRTDQGAIERGAEDVGRAAERGAEDIGRGAQDVGRAAERGAEDVGRGAEDVGEAGESGMERGRRSGEALTGGDNGETDVLIIEEEGETDGWGRGGETGQSASGRGGAEGQGEYFWTRRLSQLIGTEVQGRQAEDLGEIENVMIDTNSGHLVAAIISYGGVLGIGEDMSAVPWSSVTIRPRQEVARIDADQKMLEAAKLEGGEYPEFDRSYVMNLYQQFDQEPYWQVYGYVPGREQAGSIEAWKADSQYNQQFKADEVQTMQGTIQSVGTFHPESGSTAGLRLRVKTQDGKSMIVHAGPRAYASQKGLNFHYGDEVTITGSQAKIDGQNVVLASQLKKGDQTLQLRNEQGQPQWDANQLQQMEQQRMQRGGEFRQSAQEGQPQGAQQRQQDRQRQQQKQGQGRPGGAVDAWKAESQYNQQFKADQVQSVQGTVQQVGMFQPEAGAMPGLMLLVQAQEGQTQMVHLGPVAFVQQKGLSFNQGDQVQIQGATAQHEGQSIIMATQVQKDDQTLQLRDEQGQPQWDASQLEQMQQQGQGQQGQQDQEKQKDQDRQQKQEHKE